MGGLAFIGLGVDQLHPSDPMKGAAFAAFGVAMLGLGAAYLRMGDPLRGVAFLGAGVASIGVGVLAVRDGEPAARTRRWMAGLTRDPGSPSRSEPG